MIWLAVAVAYVAVALPLAVAIGRILRGQSEDVGE